MHEVWTETAADHEVFVLVAFNLQQDSAVLCVDEADARVVRSDHHAVGHRSAAHELDSCDLLALRELARPIPTFNLYQVLQ